jgi:flagellar assembly protein FliH
MQPWRETLAFRSPLREVEVHSLAPLSPGWDRRIQEQEQNAFEQGRQAGEKALSAQLVQQRAELIELKNGVIESLRQALPQVIRDAESAVLELAVEIARRFVCGLPISAEMVEASVKDALSHLENTTQMTILLNSEDLVLLQKANSPLVATTGESDQVRYQASTEVTRGGCLIETRFGLLDGRRETRIAMLRKELQLE